MTKNYEIPQGQKIEDLMLDRESSNPLEKMSTIVKKPLIKILLLHVSGFVLVVIGLYFMLKGIGTTSQLAMLVYIAGLVLSGVSILKLAIYINQKI